MEKYVIFCDLDGTLCDYMGGVLTTMNEFTKKVTTNSNYYKTKYTKLYASAKKAIKQQGGDLVLGELGPDFIYEDVCKGTEKKHVRNLMYSLVANNRQWWATLKWLDDGPELWSYIKKYNPIACTGPMGPNSKLGKMDWCKRELNIGKDRIVITHTKHEEIRKVYEKGNIPLLIDDMPKYVVPWQNAGGIAIHHKDAASTIEELKKLGL